MRYTFFRPRSREPDSLVSLPPEIWDLILEELAVKDLQNLTIVNRLLRSLALPKLYSEVDLSIEPERILKYIECLRDNPDIASCVRTLKLHALCSHQAISNVRPPLNSGENPDVSSCVRILKLHPFPSLFPIHNIDYSDELWQFIMSFLKPGSLIWYDYRSRTEAMKCAAKNLVNVKELHYAFRQPVRDCPLFLSILPLIAQSLESLSLKWADYGLFNHEDFGKPWWDLKALSGLELPNLRTFKMLLPAKCSNFGPSFQSLVHRLPDTLDFLAIYFPLDESMRTFKFPQDMEQTFAKFRELQAFHIKVPMFLDNHGQLIDPTPISNMLRNLHSLRHVTVATSHSGEIPVELLRDWMERCYSGISLPIPAPPITFRIL